MYIHRCIYFSSCSYLLTMPFLFAMQVADRPEGEVIYDAMVYEKMRMKKPDLSQPQPQQFPEYFGHAQEARDAYCATVMARHPEVEDPLSVETDEESLLLSSHGLPHGRLEWMNAAVKHSLTTSFTKVKATNTSAPIPPRRQSRRPTYDVSFHHLSYFRSCMAKC